LDFCFFGRTIFVRIFCCKIYLCEMRSHEVSFFFAQRGHKHVK